MADNPSNGGGGGGDDNNGNELMVSIAALVISIIAFFISAAQALQQYYASATGFSNCSVAVMDSWGEYTRRSFRWSEFRFEVIFQAPVLFIAAPDNKFGPVQRRPIYYLTGGDDDWLPIVTRDKDYIPTWWDTLAALFNRGGRGVRNGVQKIGQELKRGVEPRQSVRTTDTEKASWLVLLQAVDDMEKKSSAWQELQYCRSEGGEGEKTSSGASIGEGRSASASGSAVSVSTPALPVATVQPVISPMHKARTIAVAVQARSRSWDTMPASTNKPLATTTIGHVVELAAVLGLHWSEFDQKQNQYRADGNGFKLSGSFIDDTGVVFKMFKTGRDKWEGNRLIPAAWVKEFCFGYVPTIFRADVDPAIAAKDPAVMKPGFKPDPTPRDIKFPADAEINSSCLHTLQLGSRQEISETLVLLGCNTITRDHYSKEGKDIHLFPAVFELIGMLSQTIHMQGTSFQMLPNPTIYQWDDKAFSLLRLLTGFEETFCNFTYANNVIPERIFEITHRMNEIESLHEVEPRAKSLPLLDYLHNCLDEADRWLRTRSPVDVLEVVRRHVQEVMAQLNHSRAGNTIVVAELGAEEEKPFLDCLNDAAPGTKESVVVDVYFNRVRPVVIGERRAGGSAGGGVVLLNTPTAPNHARDGGGGGSPVNRFSRSKGGAGGAGGGGRTPVRRTTSGRVLDEPDPEMLHLLWCMLMFRMVCWLMLHDFHKKDIQKPRSELLGSRFPVYFS